MLRTNKQTNKQTEPNIIPTPTVRLAWVITFTSNRAVLHRILPELRGAASTAVYGMVRLVRAAAHRSADDLVARPTTRARHHCHGRRRLSATVSDN